eukprot:TRINITY_DN9050_c0_g1_i1.p1 TRINITY_DN9050_c0_g1~~TRINITY_DN9050_c0_g1_i1.p1  ORF type:complete len:592 (-),score=219.64 TRINITY_DN9050_c0_g1_i1:173-1948(-)
MAQGEVLEGFLCPLCMKDLGDVIQLQVHFEESHSKEDQAFVQSLKDLFGKAKKRILSDEEAISTLTPPKLKLAPSYDNIHPVSGIRLDIYQTDKDPGSVSRGHFADFKKIRSSRVDRYATETNRLIVRLDKLLENMPTDASKRRDHERHVVPWIDEDLVKLCPTCARGFNIARRKHHCRLCGSVMCQDCSQFVDFNFCRRLINPSTLSSYKQVDRQGWSVNSTSRHDSRSVGSPARSSIFKLRRSGSRESVGSVMSIVDGRGKEEFRSCGYCKSLLSHRENIIELATAQPIISQFYDKLRDYTAMGEEMSPKYVSMYESLTQGETSYHSSDAKLLRVKLLKVAENIDMMSKKIQALGLDTLPEGSAGGALPRRFMLQNQIRRASVNFIKETLVGLPSLPSDDELLVLQEKRKEEISKKVEEERKKAAEARLKFQNIQERRRSDTQPKMKNSPSGGKFNKSNVSYASGFVLSSSSQAHVVNSVNDDPMVQQMTIIRGYIQQARDANRFDEVSMLETNLKMLQEEFKRQKISEKPPETAEAAGYVSFSGVKPTQFDENRKELTNGDVTGDTSNPFGGDSEDEYDASGKNPFAE